MVPASRVLDLIEAIETSAERRSFKFSISQQILITKLRRKATQGLSVPDECWENLCELYNLVEGRYRPISKDFIEESNRSINGLVYYGFIPAIVIFIGLIILGAYLIAGGVK